MVVLRMYVSVLGYRSTSLETVSGVLTDLYKSTQGYTGMVTQVSIVQ